MSIATTVPIANALRRVQRLQILTIVWMSVEIIVALGAAWKAQSPALMGFGGDSVVELLSAIIVLWRFGSKSDSARIEKLASRVAGALLFVLAIYVLVASALTLLRRYDPKPSLIGIILLIVAGFGMPWLGRQKRELASDLSSASLKADAVQSSLCGYLSWIALAGLLVNAVFHKSWADPIAAVVLVPFIINEGWEAVRTKHLGCECS